MPVIAFASPKGGVGKTTLAANVGAALARLGGRTLLIDLDVQNALRLHFGVPVHEPRGFASAVMEGRPWIDGCVPRGKNILLAPFGVLDPQSHSRFCAMLENDPNWLANRLKPFLQENFLIVIDTPPGPSIFLEQVSPLVDLKIVVLLSDPVSISLLPTIESGHFFDGGQGSGRAAALRYIFNQVDPRRRLNRDLFVVLRQKLGAKMLGSIYIDEAFGEAVAFQRPVIDFAPSSKAARDVMELAMAIDKVLRRPGAGETAAVART